MDAFHVSPAGSWRRLLLLQPLLTHLPALVTLVVHL